MNRNLGNLPKSLFATTSPSIKPRESAVAKALTVTPVSATRVSRRRSPRHKSLRSKISGSPATGWSPAMRFAAIPVGILQAILDFDSVSSDLSVTRAEAGSYLYSSFIGARARSSVSSALCSWEWSQLEP